ncbi:phytoene desaturase family protein [Streptoalloteichus tenebrarius]|uniref:phytoene desaturase family protein n=1 Tax=Streptoalloteichus tenebrarius (strain ATCC 17920 / DSM 40477 / JCM 4838 / CBS 697.72 / NBRC 16177 / NCIMB 11028 / NRRL B-12390 / A12253. 1 / ISP 5477) TaxID=1933 RepID=UPI0020A26830|nr:phytoene desaturase family protein [Streptoalloteichus tenebrarius]
MRTVPGRTDHVVVVGAGLSGLSTALHLLGAGREVTVLEREPHPGGRTGRLDVDGFRIDTGPTVMTMPELVDEALAAVGSSLEERLELTPLHPAYRARFADGSTLDVHTDAEAMEAEVRRVAGPAEALGYRRLRRWLTELYRAEFDRFIAANFDSALDLVHPSLAKVVALGAFGRLDRAIGRFVHDERVRRVFSFQALYAGLSPRKALAAYAVIAYMDTIRGVFAVRGGMRQLPQALADAATEAGATFRYDTTVTSLERDGSRVTAVRTAHGERIPCDAVVLTTDLPVSYRLLGRAPRRPVGLRWSPSAVVLHLAGDRGSEDPAHHTISFGASWDRTFHEIIRQGRPMTDPSLLVSTPTSTDPGLAPEGRHLHFVLAPCPNLQAGPLDWSRLTPAYVEEIRDVLGRRGLPAADGELLHVSTPLDWAAQGHAAGTPFSAAHTFAQTGPFRPRNLVRGAENVVLAGSGTTPGVGIPTTLISGRLAAARLTGR